MNKVSVFHFLLILVVMGSGYESFGQKQKWDPQDTLKTIEVDSTRIDQFRNNMIDYTGQDLIDASFPNSWPLFGTNVRMAIGGYMKLDYIQDFDGGYDRFQYEIQNVPVPGDGRPLQSGYMNMHVRESRVNLDVRTITKAGRPLRLFFEFDFYNLDRGPFNQTPRLRHFYGVLGRLLVGRTWSTQSDLFAIATTIDFAAGDALTGSRRAQIRFEDKITDNLNFAVGLEMLEFTELDGNGFDGKANNRLPLLASRLTKKTSDGSRFFLGASLYELRWDGEQTGPDDTAIGWGVSFSGRKYFGKNKHYFIWMSSYGNGWGTNIVATLGSNASAILTPEGNLETMTAWNLNGGVALNVSPTVMVNFNTAWFGIDPSEFRSAEKIKRGGSFHSNIIWSPFKNVNAGVEFMSLYRQNVDGDDGTGNRLQFMIKYLF